MPLWEDFNKFLTERFQALESVSDMINSGGASSSQAPKQKFNNFDKSKNYKVHHTKVNEIKCDLCKGTHALKSCPKFLSMDFKDRLSVVKREKRCINCLALGHMSAECRSRTCKKCSSKHHTLLHKEQVARQSNSNSSVPTVQTSQNQNLQSADTPSTSGNVRTYHTSVLNKTLLATAWVNVVKDGLAYKIRALIDPCSDDTFISKRIQKLLKLPTQPIAVDIMGLGGEHVSKCSKIASFTIGSMRRPTFSLDTDALVVSDVTGSIPTHTFENALIEKLPNLEFAEWARRYSTWRKFVSTYFAQWSATWYSWFACRPGDSLWMDCNWLNEQYDSTSYGTSFTLYQSVNRLPVGKILGN